MSALAQFEVVHNPTGDVLAHKALPVWVVSYSGTNARQAFHQGYIAVAKLINGRHPCMGGVDNRRVGSEDGFQTVEEACAAAIAKAGGVL